LGWPPELSLIVRFIFSKIGTVHKLSPLHSNKKYEFKKELIFIIAIWKKDQMAIFYTHKKK
jgi:hypothetical protein